ncbi:IclR family transcriptional regulator [Modestobacter roseus]|uniref:IclR family transcriptional regulator n=1 Tax=Modestobacter roseus TaxID=1181884 RepID=A0A562IS26_9ACTN|nr:helix-turn-helix domain-containing protein [Modestobacter roseus]MQA35119.1 helix-turn-helix domain-containing protein [Modestobacter roseus]TWH73650.1 IclR family transcriptional regulator [Modestobacter roseus]
MDLALHGRAARDTHAAPAAEAERAPIQAIDRAANVLSLLDQDTRRLTAGVVAARLGLNRTTAHRYLQALQQAGFLNATAGPGPLLDQLSALVSVRQQLITLAPAVMRHLADTSGLTAVLSFLGRTGAVVTLVEEPQQTTILLTVRVGTVLEVKAAQTRVLLAFQSDPTAVTRAHATLTEAQAAVERQALRDVRRRRLAWADLDRVGLASVAVPVLATYDVQAAMALIGTSTMLNPAGTAERVRALQDAATSLGGMVAG